MQLPRETSTYNTRVRFGRYVSRRLKASGRGALAADVAAANQAVKQTGRNVDDREDEIQDPLADRDAADDALDRAAQEARAALAGRSVEAPKTAPYINIFPEGITPYTAAPLDLEVARYNELKSRLEKELPAQDAVRLAAVSAITANIAAFTTASAAVEQARTSLSLAETEHARATDAWTRLIEKVYGSLIAEVGKAAAETYFPRNRTKKAKTDE